jgi:hypothetical protein
MEQEFIYDDRRIYAKLYVFFKFIGLIFYLITLSNCYNPNFYIGMIVVMFLSMINSIRYEYAHFRRYGTQFSSIIEYNTWRNELLPKSLMFFAMIELSIKTAYFVKTYPPDFQFDSLCRIGESIFKIHILALFSIYIISGIFSIFILSSFCCNNYLQSVSFINEHNTDPLLISIPLNDNQTEECCICLDIDNSCAWSILPCSHKFHNSCITTWLLTNQTCPICRLRINPIS